MLQRLGRWNLGVSSARMLISFSSPNGLRMVMKAAEDSKKRTEENNSANYTKDLFQPAWDQSRHSETRAVLRP
jgi:hypothetical protein